MSTQKTYDQRINQSASRYRDIIINTLGNKCAECGKKYDLVIHHKKYEIGMTINDVKILCNACHRNAHLGRDIKHRFKKFHDYLLSFNKENILLAEIQTYATRGTLKKYLGVLVSENKINLINNKSWIKGTIVIKNNQGEDTDETRRNRED